MLDRTKSHQWSEVRKKNLMFLQNKMSQLVFFRYPVTILKRPDPEVDPELVGGIVQLPE